MLPCRSMWSGLRLSRTPTVASRLGVRSIWKDDSSSTWMRSAAGGSSASTGTPMLPPIATSWPSPASRCAVSAVVVDLPLVPVIAISGARGARDRRSRQNSSTSPMMATPASRASLAAQCGSGWVSGTPGDSTRNAKRDQSASRRLTTSTPSARAASRPASPSSQAATLAPPARRARAVASPEPPRPNRATCCPLALATGVISAPSGSTGRPGPARRR